LREALTSNWRIKNKLTATPIGNRRRIHRQMLEKEDASRFVGVEETAFTIW
jgi:hypothetical protein